MQKGLMKGIFIDKRFRGIRIVIFLSIFVSILSVVFSFSWNSLLRLIQLVIIPHLVSSWILAKVDMPLMNQRVKIGALIGIISGGIPITIYCLDAFNQVLSMDWSRYLDWTENFPVDMRQLYLFITYLFAIDSMILAWVLLVSICAFCGLLAVYFPIWNWRGQLWIQRPGSSDQPK